MVWYKNPLKHGKKWYKKVGKRGVKLVVKRDVFDHPFTPFVPKKNA